MQVEKQMNPGKPFAQPFQDYEIVERLGAGGMGVVFRARRKSDGMELALKVLHPSRSRNHRYLERLRREAEISMRLDHPHVVKGHGFGEEGGYHFLVMSYAPGKSLRDLLKLWGHFPEGQVREIARQLADALRSAHEMGIVHRDVKPGNVLVDDDGQAMLTDLGLAKADTDTTVTRDGATVGTPQYMSPEQAKDPASVDERGDLYSLGATLYHMLVGSPPFEGDSVGQLVHRLMTEPLQPASEFCEHLSPGFDLVLRKLLARDPEQRYQSARELLADLDRLEAGEMPKVNERALRTKQAGSWSWSGARTLLAGLAALLLLGVVFLLWPRADRDPREKTPSQAELWLAQLRQQDAFRFGQRLRYLAEPKTSEIVGPGELARLRNQVTERFRQKLGPYLEQRFDKDDFVSWIDAHGLDLWRRAYLQGYVVRQLEDRFDLSLAEFPAVVRQQFETWQQERGASLAGLVQERVHRLVQRVQRDYEDKLSPGIEALWADRAYGSVEARLRPILEDPLSGLLDSSGRALRIPAELDGLFDGFRARVRSQLGKNSRLAAADVERFRSLTEAAVESAVELATDDAGHGVEKARALLDQLSRERLAPGRLPWKDLPRKVEFELRGIQAKVELAREKIDRLAESRDRALLRDLCDTIHDGLSEDLDVARARRTLGQFRFDSQGLRAELQRLHSDLNTLERCLEWMLSQLARKSERDEHWFVRGQDVYGRVLRIERKEHAPPVLLLRDREHKEHRVQLHELLPRQVLDRLEASAPEKLTEHRLGIGLFLLYSDRLASAQDWLLRAGRFDGELRVRVERRRQRLAIRARDRGAEIERRMRSAERYLNAGRSEAAAEILRALRASFADEVLGSRHQPQILKLEHRAARLIKLRALREQLDPRLRGPDTLQLEGEAGKERLTARVAVNSAASFGTGLDSWRKQGGSFVPFARSRVAIEEKALAEQLRLPFPVFAPKASSTLRLELAIPGEGPALDALVIEWWGARLLFVQDMFQARAQLLSARGASENTLAQLLSGEGSAAPFLLRGALQQIELERGPERIDGRRRWTVRIDGHQLWSGKLRDLRGAKAELRLSFAGGMGFRLLEIEGAPR